MDETADDDIGKEKAEIRNMKGHVNYGMSIYGNGSGPESSPDSDTLTSIQDGIANKIAMLFGTNKEDGKDVESLSKESGGIQRQLNRWWNEVVSKVDPRLWRHMRYLGYKPEDFALRWMLVWCAREFPLDEVIKLWDSLIAEKSFEIVKKNTEIKKEAEAPSEIKGMVEQQEGNKTKNEVKSEDSGASGMRNPNTSSQAQISQDNRPNRLVRKGDAGGGGGGRGGGGGGMFSFMSFMNIQSMMYTDASASARPKPKENVQYIVKDIDLRKSRRESLDKNVIIVKNLDDFSRSQEIIVKPLATENNTITKENGINKEGLGKGASNEIRLKDGPSFLMYFITAMLVVLREPILKSDFSGGMLALQTFSQENTTIIIEDLLNVANQIKNIFVRYSGSLPASGVINELALPKIDLGLEEHDYSTQPDVNADNERMNFYDTDQNTDTTTNVNTKNYDDGVSSKDIHVSDNDTEKNGKEENMDGRGSKISLTQLAEHNKNHVLEEELNGADPTTPVDPPSLDKQYSISLPKSEEKRGGSTDNVNYQKSIEDSSAIIISNSPLW
ncbi:hypothetical protein AX774_g2004 [Zancudomyces culisetae]|uniref:Rab-GAP TBC domain-containing protein n=1 Tax=Zancudomyces culisetae TaxID=1213189 RepID=A0A1R1PU61_ZANCU|nr:hypothetical protein AX774_g2004 [Zancudomyces culisetae]|eukprot:OMH84484.1 hypothetical protein AX774_g2004 [Zancudomyces culisetae]